MSASIQIPVSVPPQIQNAPAAQDGNNSSATGTHTVPASAQSSGNGNSGTAYFSALLVNAQQVLNNKTSVSKPVVTASDGLPVLTANISSGSGASASSASGSSSAASSASGASGSNTAINALMALLASLPEPVTESTHTGEPNTTTSSASGSSAGNVSSGSGISNANATSSASGSSDALVQLQKLLQQLLALAQQTSSTAASNASSSNGSASAAPAKPAAGKTVADATSVNQIVTQIIAIIPQVSSQLNTSTSPAANSSAQDGAIADNTSSNTNASTGALLAQLSQLTRELAQKLSSAPTDEKATANNSASSGNGSSLLSASALSSTSSFDAALTALLKSSGTTDTLQSALASVSDVLNNAPGGKQAGAPGNTSPATNDPALASQNIPAAIANPPSVQDSGFAKLVSPNTPAAPVADQVLVQIKNAISDGSSQIKIQLSPADLGKVVVQLNTSADGKTGITITADNRQTLSMLQNEARSLESSLRDIGLKTGTGGLSFNLSGQQNQQQTPGKQNSYAQVAATTTDEDADYQTTATTIYRLSAQQGLDIRV